MGIVNHLRPGKYTTIFPPTRSPPEPQVTSILQSAERGANYLRTYLPDVDIPAELIRDQLAQDAKITEALDTFNPYMGNLLQHVVAHDSAFMAFPMGELNRDLNLLRTASEDESADHFWRLARGVHDTDYLLASKKLLSQIDMRSNDSLKLFKSTGVDLLTSVQDQGADHIIKLCSTREIVWIDARFAKRPLLGYKHGRQYDRYLEIQTSPLSSALTLLTSRTNAMVTVYDVSRSEGRLIHVNALPHSFISAPNTGTAYQGQVLFKHPLDSGTDVFSLIRLSEQGSLHQVDLSVSDEVVATFETSWTTDVKELELQPPCRQEAPYASQAYAEADLSSTYDQIFCRYEQERAQREDDNAKTVYDLLETIPTFWQEVEVPPEHILTTYDVVLRAGDEPVQTSRADFLTESIINSTRGYRALIQGRLTAAGLSKGASWHKNITAILQRLDPTFPDDVQSGTEGLKHYDLADAPKRSAESIRYEKEAREHLALDLALSADVFSSQPFLRASDEGIVLEALTKTLSLAGEPPAVDFGYLRPKPSSYYKTEDREEAVASMGVRSLLKDWEIGADPEEYLFTDHYDGTMPPMLQTNQRARPTQTTVDDPQPLGTQLQRPPTIVAASDVPTRPPEIGRRMFIQSQPDFGGMPPPRNGSQTSLTGLSQTQPTQDYMMSTQILPGVHGGRPTVPKKKAAKRRVGGF
ncbi:hypothetical protein C0991_003910 [Blastosporella zonata]|nr:hypothetical protein C0991_003910 [Blastosporella zonata]